MQFIIYQLSLYKSDFFKTKINPQTMSGLKHAMAILFRMKFDRFNYFLSKRICLYYLASMWEQFNCFSRSFKKKFFFIAVCTAAWQMLMPPLLKLHSSNVNICWRLILLYQDKRKFIFISELTGAFHVMPWKIPIMPGF